ncbi:MFS transporter [Kitasatospora sp. MAP5-34]|uniref:MFS transporter n=1 Tax=Kitasatospora sp. MAP5-34 TaxID=3035102 RepID=UPI002474B9AC|nr:MFS transporter [Kitasatospora sp. MAP5-34]MDH6579948.1 MFS family permease [Kitasatospora sp. MAP5-34]
MNTLARTDRRAPLAPTNRAPANRDPAGLSTAVGVAAVTVLTALPVFLPGAANGLISAEFGWSPARMGAVLAVYWLASLSGAFASKRAALPPAIERTLAIALCATCLGLFSAAVAPVIGLWVSSAVGGFAYGYTQPHTNALLMQRCAPRLRALAFGLKQAAVPAATLLASMAIPVLAGPAGWRPVFAGTAVLCGVGGGLLLARHRPSDMRSPAAARVRGVPLRVDGFLLALSCAGFFGAMVGNGLGGFLVLALTTRGASLSVAGAVATAGAALNIVVRLVAGWVVGRIPRIAWAALTGLFMAGAAGTALLAHTTLAVTVVGALLACGGGWGWAGLLHYVIGLPYAGQEQQATACSQMGVSLGAATGPMVCGLLFTVSPDAAWWALTAAGAAAAACVLVARARIPARPDSNRPTVTARQ